MINLSLTRRGDSIGIFAIEKGFDYWAIGLRWHNGLASLVDGW